MGIVEHIVVFSVAWWLILFMVLPFGVRNHHESGEEGEDGIEMAAPVKPNIGKKMLITTGITFVVWLCFWAIIEFKLISLG
ncbi:DUF1467 family protein [Emcibacter sp.]|uniref:DUF1467 family protein n=1 Tax=Emcibacter sp. TaxID=1979954 RepID=UPI002AA6C821|nr:DUF1467 family protein [Emcibacter sp.]